uniref:uncharacterized protein n=1 Tax=Semicossyphus pulcher TaxID=241346 RepID=UPI0037E90FC0
MTPVFLFLVFLSLRAVPSGAAENKAKTKELSDVSEVIAKVNDGIKTRLVHGDIMPNLNRNADPCTSKGCKWPKRGKYVYVPVIISSRYTKTERMTIIKSLVTFHKSTCIRFVWRRWWHRHYLFFYSGSGCWSYLGRQNRGQPISLKSTGCLSLGTVQHEVLHALGFHHEHVRSDRDTYVSILTNNIQPGVESNFVKQPTNNLQTPYDFKSVMHYSKYAFSRNGQPTILSNSDPSLNFGQSPQMSKYDIARVNKLYKCCELNIYNMLSKTSDTPCELPIKSEELSTCCIHHQTAATTDLFQKFTRDDHHDDSSSPVPPLPLTEHSSYISAAREEMNFIIRGLRTFHASTCIRFVWRKNHRDYLHFYSGNGCFSYVGRQSGGQPVSLRKRGCLTLGTVQHEVLHALGFHHEQVRSDRDTYVSILDQNIQPRMLKNFKKERTNNLGTPYDFDSVMHHSKYAFTRNGRPTILARRNPNRVFGRASRMSRNDINRVNRLYQCCKFITNI